MIEINSIYLKFTFNNFLGATFITFGVIFFSAKALSNTSGVAAMATKYFRKIQEFVLLLYKHFIGMKGR